jgi:hypothetical protein
LYIKDKRYLGFFVVFNVDYFAAQHSCWRCGDAPEETSSVQAGQVTEGEKQPLTRITSHSKPNPVKTVFTFSFIVHLSHSESLPRFCTGDFNFFGGTGV